MTNVLNNDDKKPDNERPNMTHENEKKKRALRYALGKT